MRNPKKYHITRWKALWLPQTPNLGSQFYAYLWLFTEISCLFVHHKWKRKYFGLAKGEFIDVIFLRMSGKRSYWIKITCFIQTSQLCLSFLAKLSQWQEQMMNGKGIFLHVLAMSHKVQCGEHWIHFLTICGMLLQGCAHRQVFLRDTVVVI